MTSLGFNPENVIPAATSIMNLLVQANTPLTSQDMRNTMGTLELIEALDITREILLSHLVPEEVVLKRGNPIVIGSGKKYQKDKTFIGFWNDIHEEISDCLYLHFTREVELSTGTKESTHPMIRRVMKLLIAPVLAEMANFPPKAILAILDKTDQGLEGKDIFGYMARYLACGDIEIQPDNIFVARKVLQKRCSADLPKLNRLVMIRNIAEKVQEKEDETVE